VRPARVRPWSRKCHGEIEKGISEEGIRQIVISSNSAQMRTNPNGDLAKALIDGTISQKSRHENPGPTKQSPHPGGNWEEGDHALAILDICPQGAYHVLVIA
jgi:hypothetical protein